MSGEKENKQKNIHAEHRQRFKEKVLAQGLENMPEHEVLEYLLFYCIPVRDTNPLAHSLIERYGSLAAVLDASYYDLLQTPGVGEHTALFLSSLPAVFRRYKLDKWDEAPFFASPEIYGPYAVDLCLDLNRECFFLCCLNKAGRLLKTEKLTEGSLDEVSVYMREAAETVLRHKAKTVILIHNHPSGNLLPSSQDLMLTQGLVKLFAGIDVQVADHVIAGRGKYFSFVQEGLPLAGYNESAVTRAADHR